MLSKSIVTLPDFALRLFWLNASELPDGVETSRVVAPPAAPPPVVAVVWAGVEAAVVSLLPPPPQAASPSAARDAIASTAEARLIGSPFSQRRVVHSIRVPA